MGAIIPRRTRHGMVMADSAPFAIQEQLQRGCGCCSWPGDPFLVVRELPANRGNGWAVLTTQYDVPVVLYRSDQQQPLEPYAIDHRVIAYLDEARRNWELDNTLEQMDAHDAKLEAEADKQEIDMTIELSKMARHYLKKEGTI